MSQTSRSAVVELHTTEGVVGYGEACPRLYVTGEDMSSIRKDLARIEPLLFQTSINDLEDIKSLLIQVDAQRVGSSTICALELAYLDAWSKTSEKSLPQLFNITIPQQLNYSLVLPLIKPKHFPQLLEKIASFRPSKIKLKANDQLDDNLKRIKIIQEVFGNTIPIRVDVNGGWTINEAKRQIPELLNYGVRSFEQPLSAKSWDGYGALTKLFGKNARIMLDESLLSKAHATHAIKHQLCNHLNLKISKLGGLFRTLEIYQLANNNGISCQLGAHFGETSLLSSAGVLFAGLANDLTAMEGALGNFLLKEDITAKPITQNFKGNLDTSEIFNVPGWLGDVKIEVLEKFKV